MYNIHKKDGRAIGKPAGSITNLISLSVGYYVVAWLVIMQIFVTVLVAGMPDAVRTYYGISTPCEAHTGIYYHYSPFIDFFAQWGIYLLYVLLALPGWVIVFTRTYSTLFMRYLAVVFINAQSVYVIGSLLNGAVLFFVNRARLAHLLTSEPKGQLIMGLAFLVLSGIAVYYTVTALLHKRDVYKLLLIFPLSGAFIYIAWYWWLGPVLYP